MIEFILDILFNNPESISFALFGAIKKAKKAKKLITRPHPAELKSGHGLPLM